jgi:hypothetical protein
MSTQSTSAADGIKLPADISNTSSRATEPSTQEDLKRRRRLTLQDQQHGPVYIGEFTISRQELYDMGARLNGQPLNASQPVPLEPDQTFIDALQLDPAKVEVRLQSPQHSDACAGLLFELGVLRSHSAQSLLASSPDLSSSMRSLGKLLGSAQQLSLSNPSLPEHLPSWTNKLKSSSMITAGVGMQGYGIYGGIMGIAEAMKKGDVLDAGINASSIVTEVGSVFLERGLEEVGRNMMLNGEKVFRGFRATSVGKYLARGAGLIASVLTLPFDIYSAIKAFNDAANASGKEAQDHYFNAALSLTSAGLSVALGVAALAGFGSVAGPVGIAAAAILILGSRIYSAARQVDDIDDYITLSIHERWRTGWFAFTGQKTDQDILDRYMIARADEAYRKQLSDSASSWLAGEYKDIIEAVVQGNYQVELRPVKHWKHQWDATAGESPYTDTKEPGFKETDDSFDASAGIDQVPGALIGTSGEKKGVLWQLGGGNDTVSGVKDKPNYFSFNSGKKLLTGGEKDDQFTFQMSDEAQLTAQAGSRLRGGDGNDTLILQGEVTRDKPHPGFNIDLQGGTLSRRGSTDNVLLESIENVETLAGTTSHVTGTSAANRIVLQGTRDVADAGAGNDQILIKGFNSTVNGGTGTDRYFIADQTGATTLIETANEASVITMDWTLERIQSWRIDGTSLELVVLCGIDGELPKITLTLPDVYRLEAGTRILQNDKLVFITKDAYSLKPDLPLLLEGQGTQVINAIILTIGKQKKSAQLLMGGEYQVASEPESSYFIYRDLPSTVMNVQHQSDSTFSTLNLDYDRRQIESVEATYTVTSTRRNSWDYLRYQDINMTLRFTDQKLITFTNIARNRPTVGSNVHTTVMAAGIELNHQFILVMRDGTSYRIQPPLHSFSDDKHNPGRKTVETRKSLVKRTGHYPMAPVAHLPAKVLKPQGERIDIASGVQTGVTVLQGQSAIYDVYPAVDTVLKLTSSAAYITSTWNIHTQHLSTPIGREHITVSDTQLRIGRIIVLLPDIKTLDAPMETVRVFTSVSHRYDIEPEFALIQLAEINAQAYANVEAIQTDIRRHQQNNQPMADLVLIRHLNLGNNKQAVFYDTVVQDWTLEDDWSRRLYNEDLFIAPTSVIEAAAEH